MAKVLQHLDKIDFNLSDVTADVLGDAYQLRPIIIAGLVQQPDKIVVRYAHTIYILEGVEEA